MSIGVTPGVVVLEPVQVVVESSRLFGQCLKDQVVGRGLRASIANVKTEWQRPVQEISERDECINRVGKVEEEKSRDRLVRWLVSTRIKRLDWIDVRCSQECNQYHSGTWHRQPGYPPGFGGGVRLPGRSAALAKCFPGRPF